MERFKVNPLLTPDNLAPTRDDLRVLCTLNPAAVALGDEILLLVRVGEHAQSDADHVAYVYFDAEQERVRIGHIRRDHPDLQITDQRGYYLRGKMLLTSLSHLRVARSRDGEHFSFDPQPAIFATTAYESYGCEDPRITLLDGRYCITYTAVSDRGVCVGLATTTDFRSFEKHGLIFPPYQKDVAIFPRKVRGMYVCRHRPFKSEFNEASIWTAYSPDLHCWGHHDVTLEPTPGTWESERVGCGAPPICTDEGWLDIYHAADAAGRYHLGAMLSDLDHPQRVLSRSGRPVLEPQEPYETRGIYGNCVFSNGVVQRGEELLVYYGAGDLVCCGARTSIPEMVQAARSGGPAGPPTGKGQPAA